MAAFLVVIAIGGVTPATVVYAAAPTVTSVSPTSGSTAGGTSVTITGTGFTGATAVTFGGTNAASFTVVSATSITATTPAKAAGAVTVAVTTSGGTGSKASAFTYVVPAPTVTGISPTSGTTAGGTSVTITGTGFTGATSVTFGGTNATSFAVGSATSITAVTPAKAAGAVTVAVTTAGGTGSLANGFTFIVPAPTVTGLSPSSGPVAGGTTVTITGTNLTGATAVTFGGTNAASFTVVSATSITAVTPAKSAGGLVAVAVTTAGGTASAPTGFTYVGTLSITAAPGNFSYSASLTGDVLSVASSFAVGVNDSTGSGAGWNLQAITTVLTSGADTIPAANHTITGVSTTGVTGVAPTNGVAYPMAIPTSSSKVYSAAANTGTGQSTETFATRLTVPPNAAAGTYTATLTVTIAAGP